MTRIPLAPAPHAHSTGSPSGTRAASYGADRRPGSPRWAHNLRVLVDRRAASRCRWPKWNELDPTLKALAEMAAAVTIGCSWCMDFGYWEFHHQGVDPVKLRDVPGWRDSDVYTDLERAVMDYAEAMTATPPEVTDEQVERLRQDLTDEQLVELTAMVSLENYRSRVNAALGLTSQGFKEFCELRPVR